MKVIPTFLVSVVALTMSHGQTAEQVMQSVRQVAVLQDSQDLHGSIRKGRARTPLSLFLRGKDIQFALDGGKERFHLRLNEKNQQLRQIIKGKGKPFPAKKIAAPIANTDVSYEDLALTFLYWPNPKIVGKEKLNGQECWRLHVANPGKNGRYREVSVWVTTKHRALMQVLGYGPRPAVAPVKKFEITKLMNVKGKFTVKTMKVSAYDGGKRVKGITYLEFKKPRKVARRGR